MALDSGVTLQTDTLAPVPGGPVRTVLATVLINGVPTQVQMQAVVLCDASGAVQDFQHEMAWQDEMLAEMREIRRLIALFMGVYQPIPETINVYDASR